MKKLLILILIITSTSCVSTYQIVPLNSRINDGMIEGVLNKDLGDPLIEKGTERFANGIKMGNSVNTTIKQELGVPYNINLKENEILYFGGVDKSKNFFFSDNETETSNFITKQGVAINRQTKQLYLVIASGTYLIDKPYDFTYTEATYKQKNCNDCFKKELIYNGRSDNTIKIIYREFINDMARPAFTQNLNYDLSEGNMISFKGCKIQIIEAKNTGIKYKILSSFND